MTEIVRQDHAPLLDLIEMIRQGRVPLGVLSTMLGHPYSFTLAQRGLGYFIAAASNDADDAADESAAAAARDGDVVADISALLISSVLGEFEYTRGLFRTLLSPTACRNDITAGRIRMDGWSASSGSVSYDPVRGNRGSPGPGHRRAPGRAGTLHEAGAGALQDAADLGPADQLSRRARHRGRGSMAGAGCTRKGARPVPVERRCRPAEPRTGLRRPAFGTTTLQQLRAAERLSAGDADDAACAAVLAARHAEVIKALSERVVDVPAYAEGLIEQARREGWNDLGLAAATSDVLLGGP